MRVLVAMSGGVDSSVAAALALEAGHDVVGVTLKQWVDPDGGMPVAGCCTVADAEDARRVAAQLDVPYYVLDYVDEFRAAVVDRMGAEYLAGRTPNPCIECNRRVRFRALLERTAALGCDALVTGHHARIDRSGGRPRLLRGVDRDKDQSYVLHMLSADDLERVVLPVGELTKTEVRDRAAALGLRTAAKPESQDLCFVGPEGMRGFLQRRLPEARRPGDVIDTSGEVVGRHDGAVGYTVGQRKGLGLAVGERRYVIEVRPTDATVVVGTRDDLLADGCVVGGVTWVSGSPPEADDDVAIQIRYRSPAVGASITVDGDRVMARFADPVAAIAPGQAGVFYRGDEVLGGGVIAAAT
jgi:tRNA-specific 2-thiouridylase